MQIIYTILSNNNNTFAISYTEMILYFLSRVAHNTVRNFKLSYKFISHIYAKQLVSSVFRNSGKARYPHTHTLHPGNIGKKKELINSNGPQE